MAHWKCFGAFLGGPVCFYDIGDDDALQKRCLRFYPLELLFERAKTSISAKGHRSYRARLGIEILRNVGGLVLYLHGIILKIPDL